MNRAVIAFIVIALTIVAAAGLLLLIPAPDNEVQVVDEPVYVSAQETDPFRGSRTAEITVIMGGSFTCTACKNAAVVMDQLAALYPEEVNVVWKDIPQDSGDSYAAAIAARCAQRQGAFWQYHDRLMREAVTIVDYDAYGEIARSLGMRSAEFDQCFAGRETYFLVDGNIREAIAAGVTEIPFFQIGDRSFSGAQHLSTFRGVIDELLEKG